MPLSIYKRGEVWHYRGTVAGRRLRGSCRTAEKTTAQRIAADIEARQWKGHLDGPEAVLTFAQAATLYRKAAKQTRFLDKIEDYWKNTVVKSMTAGAIQQSAVTLYPNACAATRNRHVIVPTQAIINHAAEQALCARIRVKRYKVVKKERTPATWEWIQAFMGVASPHLGALACFMFLTAARISEACALTWDEVDLGNSRALIRETKVGAERIAHLPPELVAALANIGWREGKVFGYSSRSTVKPVWDAACRRAGIKPLSPHCCRHGFATTGLQAGIDIITITKLGGWKTPQHVFQTYGHAVKDLTLTERLTGTKSTQAATRKTGNKAKSTA